MKRRTFFQVLGGGLVLGGSRNTLAQVGSKDTSIEDRISSGSGEIDNLIGGGYPRRHITEIFGEYSSGKTTLALHATREVHKQGGTVLFLDCEQCLDVLYAKGIGVDFAESKWARYNPETMYQLFKLIQYGIEAGVDLIVVDGLPLDLDTNSHIARALPRICYPLRKSNTAILFFNRPTYNLSRPEEKYNTSGGMAFKYYSSLRLRLDKKSSINAIKSDGVNYYESLIGITLAKNRAYLGNERFRGQEIEIYLRYSRDLDTSSLIDSGRLR